jgi:hypothetical protein
MRISLLVWQTSVLSGTNRRFGWRLGSCCLVLLVVFFSPYPEAAQAAAPAPPAPPTVQAAGKWLVKQQNPKTGLVRSFEMPGNHMAWTYDQAVSIVAFLSAGNTRSAVRCGNTMLRLRLTSDKVWTDGYDSRTGEIKAKAIAGGPNAWMGLAMLNLHRMTSDKRYLNAATTIGAFLLKLQVSKGKADGAIAGGFNQDRKPFVWSSTEHNADAVAFLAALGRVSKDKRYTTAAVRASAWLNREMWDSKAKCFLPGYADTKSARPSDYPERLDSQTWTILAFRAAANVPGWPVDAAKQIRNGLPWIENYRCKVRYGDRTITGFAKTTMGKWATDSVWTEGSAGGILALRELKPESDQLKSLVTSLRALQQPSGGVLYSFGVSFADVAKQFHPGDIVVAHFEGLPNALFGQVGVYGDAEPDWKTIEAERRKRPYCWYYEATTPGYNLKNVHSGRQSFRLVNAGPTCLSKDKQWASLTLDLCPLGAEGEPTKPLNVSSCKKLAFWARTDKPDGANVEVLFRDAKATDNTPQARVHADPRKITRVWSRHLVNLRELKGAIDLTGLVQVGLEFGTDTGNRPGTVIYVDDVCFMAKKPGQGSGPKPSVYAQHYPFPSAAGTSWLVFVELNHNPFSLLKKPPLRKKPS